MWLPSHIACVLVRPVLKRGRPAVQCSRCHMGMRSSLAVTGGGGSKRIAWPLDLGSLFSCRCSTTQNQQETENRPLHH